MLEKADKDDKSIVGAPTTSMRDGATVNMWTKISLKKSPKNEYTE